MPFEPIPSSSPPAGWRSAPRPAAVLAALGFVTACTLICGLLQSYLAASSIALIFLSGVLFSAVSGGFWAGLLSAVLAFLCNNYFFVEPRFTLSVARPQDGLALGVFLIVAALTGFLAGRMREIADAARRQSFMLRTVADFSTDLHRAQSLDGIEMAMVSTLAHLGGGQSGLLRKEEDDVVVAAKSSPALVLAPEDMAAADWVFRHQKSLRAAALGWDGNRFAFYPFAVARQAPRVVTFRTGRERGHEDLEPAVLSIIDQGRVASERYLLGLEADSARQKADREAVRSALLSSLSHDLKTPLATIYGSVTSLRELGASLSGEARDDLLLAIEEETARLTRYVANLLHMTRLQAGVEPQLDWIDPADVVHGTVSRARAVFTTREILFLPQPALPLIHADALLLDQAMFNLIDNAIKFSSGTVTVSVEAVDRLMRFRVHDQGPAIAPGEQMRLFDSFYRGMQRGVAGTGLGLTICKGIATALGGRIWIDSAGKSGQGKSFVIDLPVREST